MIFWRINQGKTKWWGNHDPDTAQESPIMGHIPSFLKFHAFWLYITIILQFCILIPKHWTTRKRSRNSFKHETNFHPILREKKKKTSDQPLSQFVYPLLKIFPNINTPSMTLSQLVCALFEFACPKMCRLFWNTNWPKATQFPFVPKYSN